MTIISIHYQKNKIELQKCKNPIQQACAKPSKTSHLPPPTDINDMQLEIKIQKRRR